MEYKCLAAAFPDMPAPALFSRATTPQGGVMPAGNSEKLYPSSHTGSMPVVKFVEQV